MERRHRLTEELVRIEHSLATKVRRFLSQRMNLVISVALFFPFIFLSVGVNEFVSASYFTDFFNPALSKAPRYPGKHQISLNLLTHFSDSRLYVTPVGLESVSGTVECFGDFNSDK